MERNVLIMIGLIALGQGTWRPASAGPAAAPADAMVTVRTYNYARIAEERLANARVTADAIFKSAKISLQWIDCRVPQSDGAACTEPLHAGRDLMLRLMDQPQEPARSRHVLALGTSMLDHEVGGGVLMTIDPFPIRKIADQASTDFSMLLGRAIAHEIGHLLLGTSAHPREGLMRARWLQDELRGVKPAHWKFSPREAAQMRHGLAAKARAANSFCELYSAYGEQSEIGAGGSYGRRHAGGASFGADQSDRRRRS